jgi:Fe2+ transport system protein B
MDIREKIEELKRRRMSAQSAMFGLPAWAQALVGVLVAVLFISLFYGVVVWTGGILANTILNTPGGNVVITNGTTPYQAFLNLFQYVFTVGSFTGVAIVLAVVAVVFIVFYYLLGGGNTPGGR